MIKFFFTAILWMIKVFLPTFVILLPILMIYGAFNEWPIAKQQLDKEQNQSLLLVGVSGDEQDEYMQKSYLLVPQIFGDPKIHSVTKYRDGKVEIESTYFGFWFLFIFYLATCVGTYYFWVKKWVSHNKALKSQPSAAGTPQSGAP